jgi:hypothetical protein
MQPGRAEASPTNPKLMGYSAPITGQIATVTRGVLFSPPRKCLF